MGAPATPGGRRWPPGLSTETFSSFHRNDGFPSSMIRRFGGQLALQVPFPRTFFGSNLRKPGHIDPEDAPGGRPSPNPSLAKAAGKACPRQWLEVAKLSASPARENATESKSLHCIANSYPYLGEHCKTSRRGPGNRPLNHAGIATRSSEGGRHIASPRRFGFPVRARP